MDVQIKGQTITTETNPSLNVFHKCWSQWFVRAKSGLCTYHMYLKELRQEVNQRHYDLRHIVAEFFA